MLVPLLLLCTMSCKKNVNQRFVDYLKAEKNMRSRIKDPVTLQDSLTILQKKYRIDRAEEMEFLREHPEQWVILLKALRNGTPE